MAPRTESPQRLWYVHVKSRVKIFPCCLVFISGTGGKRTRMMLRKQPAPLHRVRNPVAVMIAGRKRNSMSTFSGSCNKLQTFPAVIRTRGGNELEDLDQEETCQIVDNFPLATSWQRLGHRNQDRSSLSRPRIIQTRVAPRFKLRLSDGLFFSLREL